MGNLLFFDLNGTIGQPVFNPETGAYASYADSQHLISAMNYYCSVNIIQHGMRVSLHFLPSIISWKTRSTIFKRHHPIRQ
ncbi:MAG: hypothetical protein AB1798_22320 [Spirochaetota bacterium]